MLDDHPHTDAQYIAQQLRDGAVRVVFRSLIRGLDEEAMLALVGALGARAQLLDLEDPIFREALLDVLEYRISPPDEEDTGPDYPIADTTMAFELLAA